MQRLIDQQSSVRSCGIIEDLVSNWEQSDENIKFSQVNEISAV